MRLKTHVRLIGLTLLVMAALVWYAGIRRQSNVTAPVGNEAAKQAASAETIDAADVVPGSPVLSKMFSLVVTNPPNVANTNQFAYRLSNTTEPFGSLVRNERAVLLRNAFIDTTLAKGVEIPNHLKSKGDPGSYVVQARGAITKEYRDWLEQSGAKIVSYVPNNSFLVQADAETVQRIGGVPATQSVLPFEPYYKFDSLLLPLAVRQEPSPYEQLNIVAFPGQGEKVIAQLEKMGGVVTRGAERTLLGDVFTARVPSMGLVDVAQIPEVHMLGVRFEKKTANDLSRVKLRVSKTTTNPAPDAATSTHYITNRFITGRGILVGVNDTGGDSGHPDLQGRLTGPAIGADPDGHGTHVIGSLLGDGSASPLNPPTNAPGSHTQAIFYGIAPKALAYVQDFVGPDTSLQTNTALQEILISNNSWGYGVNEYDIFAASYDAAVRDSLPGRTGEQEVAYVFAAGNDGGGSDSGLSGAAGSILSPATAKNVITVGASDQARFISNVVVRCTTSGSGSNVVVTCTTNSPWLGETDSDNQVSPYSSRGNVGIGQEGPFGRFKPDVLAPGSMVVSTRSADYNDPDGLTNFSVLRYNSVTLPFGATNLFALNIPGNAVSVLISNVATIQSPTNPLPDLPIDVDFDAIPLSPPIANNWVVLDGASMPALQQNSTMYYTIANPFYSNAPVVFDVIVRITFTNDVGDYYTVLKELNAPLKPSYRYESGTSMAAPKISGMLAMIEEYLGTNFGTRPSPALLKAMIINGARSLSQNYSLDTHSAINHQGWGIANISNSIPAAFKPGATDGPVRFFDQDITNGLATGGTHIYTVNVPPQARSFPLRLSLVWTDPPGNPISSVKLVNDLNLFVTNETGTAIGGNPVTNSLVWVGNNFPPGSDFTTPIIASSTDPDTVVSSNLTSDIELARDVVNNVENIYIAPPLGATYTVSVKAHRVNVNALNSHSNSIAQDYALVISSGNVAVTNVNLNVNPPVFENDPTPRIASLIRQTNSNSSTLLNQRVGANSPHIVSTNGATNQWAFFTYTNVSTPNFTNVMIVTFLSPNLSLPRFRDADIDLYVRRGSEGGDDALFFRQLDADEISQSQKSTLRGGTEFVLYTDAQPDEVFYIGVKSEDQQAANFAILAASSDRPFSEEDTNNIVAQALVIPVDIPDGTPDNPGGTSNLLAFVTQPTALVRRVYVTNSIYHEQAGDIIGIMNHQDLLGDGNSAAVTLNNHRTWNGFDEFVYDDSMEGDLDLFAIPTDGPGSLRNFVGHNAFGPWTLNMSDNALFHTGTVDQFTVVIEKASTNDQDAVNLTRTILPNRWFYVPVNIPFDAFNLEVCVSAMDPPNPIDVYIQQGDFPTDVSYDYYFQADPPGECLNIGLADNPPLTPGRWYIGLFNPNNVPVRMNLRAIITRQNIPGPYFRQTSTDTPLALSPFDDAVTNSTIFWTNSGRISDLRVGIRVDHERASDLVFHLRSPRGRRLLLMENRGRLSPLGIGANATNYVTNITARVFSDGFEFSPAYATYSAGGTVSGWSVLSGTLEALQSGPAGRVAHTGTNFIDLNGPTDSSGIGTNVNLTVGNVYQLSWAYTRNPESVNFVDPQAEVRIDGLPVFTNFTAAISNTWDNLQWRVASVRFVAANASTSLEFVSTTPGSMGVLLDTVRIDELGVETNDYLYTTFTENTNLTTTPIKFAQTPFTNNPNPNAGIIFEDGFELEPIGTYGVGSTLEPGWTIEFGDVDVWHFQFPLQQPPHSGVRSLDINGGQAGGISYPLATIPGVTYELSFAYIKSAAVVGDVTSVVGLQGVTNLNVVATTPSSWTSTSVLFTATAPITKLEVRSTFPQGGPNGMFYDTFLVRRAVTNQTDFSDGYFLPEESLKSLVGEQAYGEWTLEVWDNRLGPLALSPSNALLSWKLEMAFAVTNPPLITLTNSVPYTNRLEGSNVLYFAVTNSCNDGFISNRLMNITMNGGIDLVFNQFVLPTNGPGDVPLLVNVINTATTNLTMGVPPLVFPARYFLKVQNTDPNTTNHFSLDVGIFCDTNPIVQLTNNALCIPATIGANGFHDYTFTTSGSATQAIVEVVSLTGNADLYLQRGSTPPLTCANTALARCSANPGTANETIVLDTVNQPSLVGGWTWTVRVFNNESAAVDYCIRVTTIEAPQVTVLQVNPPTARQTNSTGYADYYVVNIPPCPGSAEFQINQDLAAQVTVYLRTNHFPTDYDYFYRTNETADPFIYLPLTSSSMPYPLTEGNWYIMVLHPDPITPTAYDIAVSFSAGSCDGPKLNVSAASYTASGFDLKWTALPSQSFQVQYTDVLPANWQNLGAPVTSSNGQFEFKDETAQSGLQRFYRLVELP